jgi:hypothetical protein
MTRRFLAKWRGGERGGAIEAVNRTDFRTCVDWHSPALEVAIDAENLPDRHLQIGQTDVRHFAHGGGRQSPRHPGNQIKNGRGRLLGRTSREQRPELKARGAISSVALSLR